MVTPTFADYVQLLFTLFERFMQQPAAQAHRGHPFVYLHKALIVFFIVMQQRHIFRFKAQHRWLKQHPEQHSPLGLDAGPHRTTLSRRYQARYPVVQDFITFLGQYAEALDPLLDSQHLFEAKSLFKAQGPVWHQSDRQAGRIPEKLRHLDTDATWGKSGYHGWVDGYGLHLTCNRAGFPKLVRVETATLSESQVIDEQADAILHHLTPATLTTDNSYTQASRIRHWAHQGVALLPPP